MKLLLTGMFMALVLVFKLIGMAFRARYSASTEAHPPEQANFTVVTAQDGDGGYRWVEWEGSSCGVWEARREVESRVKSPESRGGGLNGEEGYCKGVRIRPLLATTRHLGVDRSTGSHRPEPPTTSENSTY